VPATNDDLKVILLDIQKKITREEPSRFRRFIDKWKYFIMAGAWFFGAVTHKWGLFKFIGGFL
jgi:hypothetical protein